MACGPHPDFFSSRKLDANDRAGSDVVPVWNVKEETHKSVPSMPEGLDRLNAHHRQW
jgi:hypothetical protein